MTIDLFELDHASGLHVVPLEDGDGAVLTVVVDLLDLHPQLEAADEVRPAGELVVTAEVDVKTDPAEVGVSYRVSLCHSLTFIQ